MGNQPNNPKERNSRNEDIMTDSERMEEEEVRLGDLLSPDAGMDNLSPEQTMDEADLPAERADLASDEQERMLSELDVQQLADRDMGDNEALYGGSETDFDREYYDNEDEYMYYDEDKGGYHPDA